MEGIHPESIRRVALVHGYLLRGTGSNIYVRNLARALCRMGIAVTLFSQDPEPESLDFVSEVVHYRGETPRTVAVRQTAYPAPCRAVRPDIGELLPVYVYDRYPGFTVRAFPDLSTEELEAYIGGNLVALRREFSPHSPDLILSNHAVMQPTCVARARDGRALHVALLHGSALNFTVRGNPVMRKYALEGLGDAEVLAAPSLHSVGDLREVLPELSDREVVPIPPGVDLERFRPPEKAVLAARGTGARVPATLRANLAERAVARPGGRAAHSTESLRRLVEAARAPGELRAGLEAIAVGYDGWAPDPGGPEALGALRDGDDLLLYFGKYLPTKGVRVLLAALPLVLVERPRAHLVAVGFGEDREFLEAGRELLHLGRRELFVDFFLRGDGSPPLTALVEYLEDPAVADQYFGAARGVVGRRFITTGIMDQDDLGALVGHADLAVAPSVYPEAFGLVAAEALAAGVPPLLTAGSGFDEVARTYVGCLGELVGEGILEPLEVDAGLALGLARRLVRLLEALEELTPEDRGALRSRARRIAETHFGWERAARDILALAGGFGA